MHFIKQSEEQGITAHVLDIVSHRYISLEKKLPALVNILGTKRLNSRKMKATQIKQHQI